MTMRDVEGAIAEAVEAGRLNGMDGLNNWQRTVFLIAEAELLCDMGADFADDYAAEFLADGFAAAFGNIGAAEIAGLFVDLAADMGKFENEQALAAAVCMTIARWQITFPAVWIGRLKKMSDALTHRMRHKRCPEYFTAGSSYISARYPCFEH